MEHLLLDKTTYLTAQCADDDAEITVADTTNPPPSFRIRIDAEILLVTATAGATWSVTRGLEGTTPTVHPPGAAVPAVLTPGGLDQIIADALDAQPAHNITAYRQGGAPPSVETGSEVTIIFPGKVNDPNNWYDTDTGHFKPAIPGWWLAMVAVTLLDNGYPKTGYLSLATVATTFLLSTTAQHADAGTHLYMQNTATFYCDGDEDAVKITCLLDSTADASVYPQFKATHITYRYLGHNPPP